MVWNIEFQLAGLLITCIIAAICWGQQKLNFSAERSFAQLLVKVILCTVCDIASIVFINYQDMLPAWSVQLVCKLYLFVIVTVARAAMGFAVTEIKYSFRRIWEYMSYVPLVVEFIILLIFPTKIYLNAQEGALYSYGITVVVTYVFCGMYLMTTMALTIAMRKHIQKRRKLSVGFFMLVWLCAAMIQFANNRLLIISFAMSVACMYMFCRLENPEYHLDFSTNVFNKRGFVIFMEENLKSHSKKSLVNVSINELKNFNDVFGNKTTKKLVNDICQYFMNGHDVAVFNLEDNLFSICLEEKEDLTKYIEYLKKGFSCPWDCNGTQVMVNVSMSFVDKMGLWTEPEELEEIIHYVASEEENADQQVIHIDETYVARREKSVAIQHALEHAITNNGVEVHYQPIYSIAQGKFNSMEALVRIRDASGNLIMPGDFIEYAEKNGMIFKLGETVFRKVCEFIQRNHVEDYGIDYIEVNLSVVQCMQEDLATRFSNIMGEYQIAPHRINLEITETAAINSKRALEKNMQDLIAYGASFSLDDYGSGYSNLTYLVEMPVKIIKIDRELTIAYEKSAKARVAIEHTIEMAHTIGMYVLVEGIETEEQYIAFKKLGVEYIQGYYFSRPLPADRVLSYCQEWL